MNLDILLDDGKVNFVSPSGNISVCDAILSLQAEKSML